MQLKVADIHLPYPLHFHALDGANVIIREARFEVSCFPVYHRIECWGFIFREVRPFRRINPEKARQYEVPSSFFDRLKWGESYLRKDGMLIENQWVTEPASKAKSYAYTADTLFDPRIADSVRGVDILYHETTYLKDLEVQAGKRFHSTTTQAATIANPGTLQSLPRRLARFRRCTSRRAERAL